MTIPELPSDVILERMRYGIRRDIGEAVLHSMELKTWTEPLFDSMAVALSAELLAERIGSERITRKAEWVDAFVVPDGRWQRYKKRHDGRWWMFWMRWRPVRFIYQEHHHEAMLVVDVKDYATFPHSNLIFPPQLGRPVMKRRVEHWLDEKDW